MKQKYTKVAYTKVAAIGPRPFFIGGHDPMCESRVDLRNKYTEILLDLQKKHDILGYTSLALGAEQDFALSCLDMKIPYHVFIPYESPNLYWKNLSNSIAQDYEFLLKKARKVIKLDNGKFSPKKQFDKIQLFINECEYIIYKPTKINQYEFLMKNYQGTIINV